MIQLNKENIITIGDQSESVATLFWFHGYGANNWSFEPSMKMLNLFLDDRLFIVIPNAPEIDGRRSWYPLPQINSSNNIVEDHEGLKKSQAELKNLFDTFSHDSKNIIGGFSQGAALSLSYIFEKIRSFHGCIALSGYMPSADKYEQQEIQDTNIFIAHGKEDNVIEQVKKDGKTYYNINDYERLREIFGELLRETQRIKSEGDFIAAQDLVEGYGVKVDQEIHAEILERNKQFKGAPYGGFVNPELTPVIDSSGEISDIELKYVKTFEYQMMKYS